VDRAITPHALVMSNRTMPTMGGRTRPLIVKPTPTRAIQTKSDPEHKGE
jgi:hypothetical protein